MTDQTINETAAEVEQLVINRLSEFFEDVILSRWQKTTKDGVRLDCPWWASKLGMTEDAVASRIKRLRRSETLSEGAGRVPEWKRDELTKARRLLRNPETAGELLRTVFEEQPAEAARILAESTAVEDAYRDIRLANLEKELQLKAELRQATDPTDVRVEDVWDRPETLPTAEKRRKNFREGALGLFDDLHATAVAAKVALQESGLAVDDLEYCSTSLDDFIGMTESIERIAAQFRTAFMEAKAMLALRGLGS